MKKCRAIIRETGLRCGDPATQAIHQPPYKRFDMAKWQWIDEPAKLIGYECPKHAYEFEVLRMSANGLVTAIVGRN